MENMETVTLADPQDADEGCIYLVSRGEYSDYYVAAAFSTEELAQAYADEMNNRQPDTLGLYFVESCAMNPELPPGEYVREGYGVFHIQMTMEGNTTYHSKEEGTRFLEATNNSLEVWNNNIRARVMARDLEHAVKIVNTKRVIYLASQS